MGHRNRVSSGVSTGSYSFQRCRLPSAGAGAFCKPPVLPRTPCPAEGIGVSARKRRVWPMMSLEEVGGLWLSASSNLEPEEVGAQGLARDAYVCTCVFRDFAWQGNFGRDGYYMQKPPRCQVAQRSTVDDSAVYIIHGIHGAEATMLGGEMEALWQRGVG